MQQFVKDTKRRPTRWAHLTEHKFAYNKQGMPDRRKHFIFLSNHSTKQEEMQLHFRFFKNVFQD